MATSAWSTEAWTDTQQSAGGVTDLTKILWQADWSDLPDGTSLNGSPGRAYGLDNASHSLVSSLRTLNGRKSAVETFGPDDVDGDGAIPWCGFEHTDTSADFGEPGQENWFRVWAYHEPGYTWNTNSGHRKTMRLGETNSSGDGTGFNDMYTDGIGLDSNTPGNFKFIRETTPNIWYNMDPAENHLWRFGQWDCMEMYVKYGKSTADGVVALWFNGVHVKTINAQTSNQENSRLQRNQWIAYYNPGIPYEITSYYCAPAIAVRNSNRDDTPYMEIDAVSGLPFIGTAT